MLIAFIMCYLCFGIMTPHHLVCWCFRALLKNYMLWQLWTYVFDRYCSAIISFFFLFLNVETVLCEPCSLISAGFSPENLLVLLRQINVIHRKIILAPRVSLTSIMRFQYTSNGFELHYPIVKFIFIKSFLWR